MADDWVITLSYQLEPSLADMDDWENALARFDASVSRTPARGTVDVTAYSPGASALAETVAATTAAVSAITKSEPVGIEVMRETEHRRRAEEPTIPELMSAAEIAEELGVSRQRIHQLRDTELFPAPLADLRGGAVWDARAIRKFQQEWDRKPGRPTARTRLNATG